MYKYKTISRFR